MTLSSGSAACRAATSPRGRAVHSSVFPANLFGLLFFVLIFLAFPAAALSADRLGLDEQSRRSGIWWRWLDGADGRWNRRRKLGWWRVRRLRRRILGRWRSRRRLVTEVGERKLVIGIGDPMRRTMHREKELNEFVARLHEAAGENLRAVVLYGSAADHEFHEEHSDLNVLCLLRSACWSRTGETSACWILVVAKGPPVAACFHAGGIASVRGRLCHRAAGHEAAAPHAVGRRFLRAA